MRYYTKMISQSRVKIALLLDVSMVFFWFSALEKTKMGVGDIFWNAVVK